MDLHVHIARLEVTLPPSEAERETFREVLTKLSALTAQGHQIMATVSAIKQLVSDIDTETNAVAAKVDAQTAAIQALKDQIAAGGTVTQDDLDAIAAGLEPISARLKTIGADANDPIPEPTPA